MNQYESDEFLRALDLEDSLPSTSSAQKEANQFRRKMYLLLKGRKPNPTDSNYSDLPLELYVNRMVDPSYRFCPSSDWLKP
jgi:hypothetical protein